MNNRKKWERVALIIWSCAVVFLVASFFLVPREGTDSAQASERISQTPALVVQGVLAGDPRLQGAEVEVSYADGVATLSGTVSSPGRRCSHGRPSKVCRAWTACWISWL